MRMNLLLRVFKLLSGIGSPLDIPANPHCQDVAVLRMVNLSIHDFNWFIHEGSDFHWFWPRQRVTKVFVRLALLTKMMWNTGCSLLSFLKIARRALWNRFLTRISKRLMYHELSFSALLKAYYVSPEQDFQQESTSSYGRVVKGLMILKEISRWVCDISRRDPRIDGFSMGISGAD